MNVSFKPADMDDVGALCRRGMRAADEREVMRMGLADPYMALVEGLEDSELALAAYTDHGIACMIGVARPSLLGDSHVIWLLGHDDLEKYAVRFLKESRRVLSRILAAYPRLENYVDADNAATIRWLEWLGFSFDKDHPLTSPMGFPFYRFWKEANHVWNS